MSEPLSPKHGELPGLAQALQLSQQSLAAFQRLQDQTAQLHRQFLENQEAAQRTLQTLVEQQQAILLAGGVLAAAPIPSPRPAERPAALPLPAAPAPGLNGHKSPEPSTPIAPAPSPPSEPVADGVSVVLLSVVAEKTGYPAEMLELGMALDADLGIDSIKRVEILAALQERLPNAPAVKPEHLGTLHTLRDVADFLAGGNATPADQPRHDVAQAGSHSATPSTEGTGDVSVVLLSVVAEKTGYPAEMLELGMALDADLGIDSIKRVEILAALQERLPNAPAVKPEHLGTLHTLRDVAELLAGQEGPSLPANGTTVRSEPVARPTQPQVNRLALRSRPLDPARLATRLSLAPGSHIWLVADPSELGIQLARRLEAHGYRPHVFGWGETPEAQEPRRVGGLILLAPDEVLPEDFPLRAFRWVRRCADSLRRAAREGGGLLGSVSRLDGAFGLLGLDPSGDARAGALAGLVKTASWEFRDVFCKAIDIGGGPAPGLSEAIVEELLRAGPPEVGIGPAGHCALELALGRDGPQNAGPAFGPDDVFVVTGGARGVTFTGALELARRCGPKMVLFGRTPLSEPEPGWLAGVTDETAIKQLIAAHLNGAATPREIGERYREVVTIRELRANLARLQETGVRYRYVAVDVADPVAVADALRAVRSTFGPVTGLIHGAGVLADRKIDDLTDEEFQFVYSTKVNGLENLLQLTREDPLRAVVLYSSTTARYGRAGQAAYAAANEVMNKLAHHEARRRPGCRVVALNWGPWEGGMVTPALRRVFEAEGVGLIPLGEGANFLLRELGAQDRAVEVVALAGDPPAPPVPTVSAIQPATAATGLHLAFEQRLSLPAFPVLQSHVLDGRAVLPLALHLEWLAHAGLHGNPGLVFHGCNGLRIHQGVYVDEAAATDLRLFAGKASRRDGSYFVPVELRGQRGGREVVHSRAEIVLASHLPPAPAAAPVPVLDPYPQSVGDAYRDFLFHGERLRGIESLEGVGNRGLVGTARTAPPPSAWSVEPLRGTWFADPLVLDSSFQMAILWSFTAHGAGSLPCHVGSYRQFVRVFPPGPVRVVLRVTADAGALARADIDYLDPTGRLIAQMRDYECALDPALNNAFRRNTLAPVTR